MIPRASLVGKRSESAPWNPHEKSVSAPSSSPVSAGGGRSSPPSSSGGGGRRRQLGDSVYRSRSNITDDTFASRSMSPPSSSVNEVEAEEQQAETSPRFEDTCYLHKLQASDTLALLALRYKTTEGTIQEINQLRGADLDFLPADTILVVPLSNAPAVVDRCMNLNTEGRFLELFGSRLPASFRRKRPPPPPTPPADDFGRFNEAADLPVFQTKKPSRSSCPPPPPPPPRARTGSPSFLQMGIGKTLKSMFGASSSGSSHAHTKKDS